MNNKFKLLVILTATLVLSAFNTFALNAEGSNTHHVDFFNNYLREEFELSNGFKGKGNNLLYKSIDVEDGSLITKPEDPTRKNYEFLGWYKEQECLVTWDFASDKVNGDLRLFAKWGYAQEEEELEPLYTPPSPVSDECGELDFILTSVMNFKPSKSDTVSLPSAALAKLEANKDNVLPLLEYKVKPGKTITAVYENKKITISSGEQTLSYEVKDSGVTYQLDNSTYETKAKNYEAKIDSENENYHVMLAGSSSIEFWTSSKEDLNPVVSYNHGIGGTTIEEWDEKLNARLVYPYKPKMVVYYVGINNVINSKQDSTTIWNNLEKFFNDTHAALPDTKVQYIMMNLIPGFKTYWETINTVNNQVVEYQKTNTWLTLINPGTALLKENGEPNAAYFRTDGLHLSYYGYAVWGGIIKESIFKGLEKN